MSEPLTILDAAHEYRRRGWRVLPLHSLTADGSCTCQRPRCNSAGKHPVLARWQETPPLSGADVQAYFEGEDHNVGLATGTPSGFWVLDIDLDKPGTAERLKDLQQGRKFPPTRIVQTPGGGYHYYFAMPDFNVTNSARRLPDGVDVRGTGGQVVAPPSVSDKGAYRLLLDVEPAVAPDWLLDLVRPLPPAAPVDLETLPKLTDLPEAEQRRLQSYTDRVLAAEIARLNECKQKGWSGPGWNQTTFEVACTLIELANSPWCPFDLVGVHKIVLANAPKDKDFTEAEIEGIFASALRRVAGGGRALPEDRKLNTGPVYKGDPLSDPEAEGLAVAPDEAPITLRTRTDLGNARRLVDVAGDRLRYITELKDWAVYTDGVWKVSEGAGTTEAQEMIETLIEREAHLYSDEPGEDDGPSEREKFVKWAVAQQMSARIDACVKQAQGRPQLKARITAFDRHPDLFNVKNGVVDLRTGELQPHDPELLMMLQSEVRYDPDAKAPIWQRFLERTLPDPQVRDYLQKALGYSLTGSMAEQAMFLHHGPGANGKSVFLIVAGMLAGDYAQVVPRETLLAKGSNPEHPTSVARMQGRRFLQASETGVGRRLDEEAVKGLTGGEAQTARFMGGNFFDFTPTGKIHLVTNHLPRLTDAESIWRRLHLVAWTQTIPKAERDPRFLQPDFWRATGEDVGILAWAIEGAVRWYQEGLIPPESMMRDLDDYRTDQDILGEFLSTRLEKAPTMTPIDEIYGAYQAWCFNSGIKVPMTKHDLSRALHERGYEKHRTGRARGFKVRVVPVDERILDPLATR